MVLSEAPSRQPRMWNFSDTENTQPFLIPIVCGPWHDGALHFLTLYICNDYWLSLFNPLRDLLDPPPGMQSKLHTALSE